MAGGDRLAAGERLDAAHARDVEQHAAADDRSDRLYSKLREARALGLHRGGVDAAVELPLVRDVTQRVEVGAGVAAHHDHLVRC